MSTLGRPAARAPINTSDIPDGIITTAKIGASQITTAKLADEGTLTQSAIKRSIHKAWVMGG